MPSKTSDNFNRDAKATRPTARVIKTTGPKFSEADYDPREWLKDPAKHGLNPPPSTAELVAILEKDKNAKLDALVLGKNREGKWCFKRLDRDKFLEGYKKASTQTARMREGVDSFLTDSSDVVTANQGLVGDDFIPVVGGPYYKQLYYRDMLLASQLCFFAYHHDPFGRAIIHITRDFILGRGFGIDSDNQKALAIWKAFAAANHFDAWIEKALIELHTYGEILVWWLPDNNTKLAFARGVTDMANVPKGIIPRIRLIDPSSCAEIVTHPEDIERPLYYQLLYSTQYQMYTGQDETGKNVASAKFIMQQVPAKAPDGTAQMRHFKINSMSNEKRGRGDLFPVLGYLKRLRDSVSYSMVALQKASAWAIDTTVEGSQDDINAYSDAIAQMGTIAPAGSEFVHTAKVKREYLSNSASGTGPQSEAFEWCLGMVAAGVQIPVSYYGLAIKGGQTRASALVATEPVAKKFQQGQLEIARIVKTLWSDLMQKCDPDNALDIRNSTCEVTFPEIIVQDRSAKIKDIITAEQAGYISHDRAATMAAKELEISEFDYDEELVAIEKDKAREPDLIPVAPLTQMGQAVPKPAPPGAAAPAPDGTASQDVARKSAVTSGDRRKLSLSMGA